MASQTVRLTGLDACVRALLMLPPAIGSKGGGPVRGSLYAAGKVIRDAARANTPTGDGTPLPGNMKRQVYIHRDRNPKKNGGATERYHIGVRGKSPRKRSTKNENFGQMLPRNVVNVIGGNAYYWRFVEFGTALQPPQAPLRRAFEENKARALDVFVSEMKKSVVRVAETVSKKAGSRKRRV